MKEAAQQTAAREADQRDQPQNLAGRKSRRSARPHLAL